MKKMNFSKIGLGILVGIVTAEAAKRGIARGLGDAAAGYALSDPLLVGRGISEYVSPLVGQVGQAVGAATGFLGDA